MVFESFGVETIMGLSLKVGEQQYKAAKNFLEVAFMLFRSGGSDEPNWLWGLCGFEFFVSVFNTSVP